MESEDVAQDEESELAGRQDLKGGHAGQGDGFGLLVAGLRAERHAGDALEQGVGERLEPDDLAGRVGSGGSTLGTSHSLAGQRPRTGDRVILEDGVLATVEDAGGSTGGNIRSQSSETSLGSIAAMMSPLSASGLGHRS
ncbi:hypothetical protein [Trebonia kvetii]|uniref:hypothetical protein n=1 Tax=Trebonia kvetii TaxID=2480626 RepID=UPI0016526A18|nr:hypothetical protein [Trebonia kvetii]